MKKIFLFILCFLFIGVVKAAGCEIVSGDGTKYGDEVKCGTEYFYVIESNDNTTKLFAKYNLMVGDKISFIAKDENAPLPGLRNTDALQEYCDNLALEKGYHPYYTYPYEDFQTGEFTGCRVYENIEYEHVLQDSNAEGTILVNGKSKLPLYGITYMVPEWGYDAMHDNIIRENNYNRRGNLIVEGSTFEQYLTGYKEELERQGFTIKSVEFITLDGILDLIEEISGEYIDISLTWPDDYDAQDYPDYYIGKMDIKEYVPEKYSWLYDRTYWIGSGFEWDEYPNSFAEYNDYYLSNEGFLCALGRGQCGYFQYPIGNGLRPVVIVNTSIINFKIETKTDGHGEIKAEKVEAKEGEVIRFTIEPEEGYVLSEVKVTTQDGKVLTFTNNTFTMPNANVLIEATFVVANAKTATFISCLVILLEVLAFITVVVMNHKIKKVSQ